MRHAAVLLRAEATALLTASGNELAALFSHRVRSTLDWSALFGGAPLDRAAGGAAVAVALPQGAWDDRPGFALLVRLEGLEPPGFLCALRHATAFDADELAAAVSGGALFGAWLADARAAARDDQEYVAATVARLERDPRGDPPLRALVAEGQPATRLGLRAALSDGGILVVGDCATLAEASAVARNGRIDVALVDLSLPDISGAEAVARLCADVPRLPIVAFSAAGGPDVARAALRAGARGFLRKDAGPRAIVAALHAAAAGLIPVPPAEAGLGEGADLALGGPAESAERQRSGEPLTARELELLRHLSEGLTNKEIARAMVLAEDTVKKAVQTLIAKLGATDRTHAVVLALRASLIR